MVEIPDDIAKSIASELRATAREHVLAEPGRSTLREHADLLDPPPSEALRRAAVSALRKACGPDVDTTSVGIVLGVARAHVRAMSDPVVYGDLLRKRDVLRLLGDPDV